MKPTRWFTHLTLSHLRIAIAGTLVLAAVGLAVTAVKNSNPSSTPGKRALVFEKTSPWLLKPGANAETAVGPNESRNPDSTPDIEAYLLRAFPADDIPIDATIAAQNG